MRFLYDGLEIRIQNWGYYHTRIDFLRWLSDKALPDNIRIFYILPDGSEEKVEEIQHLEYNVVKNVEWVMKYDKLPILKFKDGIYDKCEEMTSY